ncbi:hypothetical protein Tco_0252850 [Tanacetum coccineum]
MLTLNSTVNPGWSQQSSSVIFWIFSNMALIQSKDSAVLTIFLDKLTEPPISLYLNTRRQLLDSGQTNQYAEALSSIPSTVDQYLAHKMQDAVDVAVQLKYDRIREETTTANQQFLRQLMTE